MATAGRMHEAVSVVRSWRRRRLQRYELARMTDHAVADIGIGRAALAFELSRPRRAGRARAPTARPRLVGIGVAAGIALAVCALWLR